MSATRMETDSGRQRLVDALRELITALDGRVPQLEREGENRITSEAAALKASAEQRIAQLESVNH